MHDVQKVKYTNKEGIRDNITPLKIQEMLSEKGKYPFKKDINLALIKIPGSNFVGSFKPPSLSQKAMARLSQQLGKIAPQFLIDIRGRLDGAKGTPLLQIQSSTGNM